jgi:DNA modification methylase
MTNRLYYGDNLDVLREHIASESVDLIYLDPPFNSNANYNILFKSPAGKAADSQIEAFEDTWHWNDKAEAAFHDVMKSGNTDVAELLRAMRGFLKENDMMAYLAMMAVRLIELHRVLKPTGSLYLHCDPTASHYLKLLLDGVFGAKGHFRNEIVWCYTGPGSPGMRQFMRKHDTIFWYAKSDTWTFNADDVRVPHSEKTKENYKPGLEGSGFVGADHVIHERGKVPEDYWNFAIAPRGKEYLGYPTQKPLKLLERIINASSNKGEVVLDPFCGCGTAVDAAQKLERQWIGIDVTHLSIGLIERRLVDRYGPNALATRPGAKAPLRDGEDDARSASGEAVGSSVPTGDADAPPSPPAGEVFALAYEVIGTPNDLDSALKLAADEPHQFQYWITQAVDGQPYQGGRKGMDRGIDGYLYFTGHNRATEAAIISVKAGKNVGVAMVRDLKGVIEREKAPIGIFICAVSPTREMDKEAAAAGVYEGVDGRNYPRLQIYTLAEYFAGLRPKVPLLDRQAAYKKAARDDGSARQGNLI